MKRGPKPKPPEIKRAQGSFQPSRGGDLIEIQNDSEGENVPQRPDWLTPAGEEVWLDDIARVINGSLVTERDSTMFGQYCNMVGAINEAWRSGDAPPTSAVAEARKMAEQFGIFGRKSRLVAGNGADKTNPFARNGKPSR